jgi:hypothetical protein
VADVHPWSVSGSYFEVCNCEAICPCRRYGKHEGGLSTYGVCAFALSWAILAGHAGDLDLAGLSVVLAGEYHDDEPGKPWRVVLYLDERADTQQQAALADIFLGRAGGATFRNFASAIGEVYAVRAAHIELDHTPRRERMRAGEYVSASTARPVASGEVVSCGIPGHDHPGEEIVADHARVDDRPLRWEVKGRCGFVTDFAYRSSD